MTETLTTKAGRIEQVLVKGDLSKLTDEERVSYYLRVCETLKLDPSTRPFDYIVLNGKQQLYALKAATDQLRARDKISLTITGRELIGDVYVVTVKARTPEGREDEDQGAVFVGGLKGEVLSNAYLRCVTKAKRRVTLSICGLGMLDETEVETIPEAAPAKSNGGLLAAPPPAEKKKAKAGPVDRDIPATPEELQVRLRQKDLELSTSGRAEPEWFYNEVYNYGTVHLGQPEDIYHWSPTCFPMVRDFAAKVVKKLPPVREAS
jgi:hypothetical protein